MTKQTTQRQPRRLIIVHGDKGGVGKSTVARLLAEWLDEAGLPFAAYDGDATKDFARFRDSGATAEIVIDDVMSVRPVLDRLVAADGSPDIALIDLSAGAGVDAVNWLRESGALVLAGEGEILITMVFVLGSTTTSVVQLALAHKELGDGVSWVVARNLHLAEKFGFYEQHAVRATLLEAGAIEIDVPSLATSIFQQIDIGQYPFRKASERTGPLGMTLSFHVKAFVDSTFAEFDRCAELFGGKAG